MEYQRRLKLQRLAFEEVGAGRWSGATGIVPVTLPGETLAPLDFTDPKHPRREKTATAKVS